MVWAWSSFLPSFESSSPLVAQLMAEGPWGLSWLRPEALFGLDDIDPLVNVVFWSLFLNSTTLVVVSLMTAQRSGTDFIRVDDVSYRTSAGFNIGAVGVAAILIALYAVFW